MTNKIKSTIEWTTITDDKSTWPIGYDFFILINGHGFNGPSYGYPYVCQMTHMTASEAIKGDFRIYGCDYHTETNIMKFVGSVWCAVSSLNAIPDFKTNIQEKQQNKIAIKSSVFEELLLCSARSDNGSDKMKFVIDNFIPIKEN